MGHRRRTAVAQVGAGRDGFNIAVSNLFQVVKSKTAAGFVPNFAAGGMRSQDRTEPPIGAKVAHLNAHLTLT